MNAGIRVWLGSCPRCSGDLTANREGDRDGGSLTCIQCGHVLYLAPVAGEAAPSPRAA